MITKEHIQQRKRLRVESFKVNATERAALQDMAIDLGVSKSVLIREGLERIFEEYLSFKAASNDESATPTA
jgi:hypothetical protein